MDDHKMVYSFDPVTGEYLGQVNAWKSPLDAEDVYLLPAHSTDTAPPGIGANQIAVFSEGVWTIVPDLRGQIWFDAETGNEVIVQQLGQPEGLIPELTPELAAKQEADAIVAAHIVMLARRDALLNDTNWTQASDVPESTRTAYSAYRQELINLPSVTADPRSVVWPERPAA